MYPMAFFKMERDTGYEETLHTPGLFVSHFSCIVSTAVKVYLGKLKQERIAESGKEADFTLSQSCRSLQVSLLAFLER